MEFKKAIYPFRVEVNMYTSLREPTLSQQSTMVGNNKKSQ